MRLLPYPMLHVESWSRIDDLERVTPEWEALEQALSPRLPFTSPLWNSLWWRHLRNDRGVCRDELMLCTLRNDAGHLVAVAPMMRTFRPASGPLRLCELQFLGADPNITEIRGPVCRPDDQGAVAGALTHHFQARSREWDWIRWRGLRTDAAVPLPFGEAAGAVPLYYLPLPPSWPELRAALPRNIRESLRKCYNSLGRDRHALRLAVVDHPDQVPAALDRFFALHRARSQAAATVPHLDMFASEPARRFLTDYALAMAARGQLRIFEAEIAGTVVATRIGFLLGRELYLYYSGYDPAWGRYSIMTTVVAEAIRWAIDGRLALVNLSTGTDVSKTRWRPHRVDYAGAVMVSPSPRGQFAYRLFDGLHQIDRRSTAGRLIERLRRVRMSGNAAIVN